MMMGFVSGLTLFVEGKVDAQLIGAIVRTTSVKVTVTAEGPKYGLRNKVKQAREQQSAGQNFFFLRDRDFDFADVEMTEREPRPIGNFGWHWCRHEIENYLLEPEILRRYLSVVTKREVTLEEVKKAICEAAASIRYYQAARWTIGLSRQKGLPYPSNLETKPGEVEEFRLPVALGDEESLQWAVNSSKDYLKKVSGALEETEIRKQYQSFLDMFTEENCQNVEWVLHHFSGKDLFVALQPWFQSLGIDRNVKRFVEDDVTPWVSQHMESLFAFIPEWIAMLEILRTVSS